MKTRKIGERFDFEEVTLEVVENWSCQGCIFDNHLVSCHMDHHIRDEFGPCGPHFRDDEKSIIFKEIE